MFNRSDQKPISAPQKLSQEVIYMPEWTTEQEEAIKARGCNLLVAAAAGSGKTAVLVERIIRLISDENNPVDVDKLLVVTFTNAAAAEMKERVGIAINKALKEKPLSRHLYRQNTLLNKASIMTLHSFCLEIVRENFYFLGIDPNFRIIDETEGELLRFDVLEEVMEKYYAQSEENDFFIKLMDAYGGAKDDSNIKELILNLYEFSQSNPYPEKWLKEAENNFTTTDWFKEILKDIRLELSALRSLLVQACALAQSPGGPLLYLDTLQEELALLDDLIAAGKISWERLYDSFSQVSFARLPSIKKKDGVDPEIQEQVKKIRDRVKTKLNEIQEKHFSRTPQELMADLELLQPYLQMLVQLVKDFSKAYREAKAKRNLVDFNDLEHYCLAVLEDENIGKKIREKYVQVLVDEYQDINDVQETILKLVTPEHSLFMVGDIKQSIYRFRLAKPELFLEKYQSFSPAETSLNRRIDLAKNFRCRQEIVDGINYLFRQIMTPEVGELSYDEKAALIYGANYPAYDQQVTIDNCIEVHLLEKKLESELVENNSPSEREAFIIGQRIKELINQGYPVYDTKLDTYRPLTYRDIVVLLRSPKGTAENYLEYFHRLGIPVYAELGSGYFKATEVGVMLSLLQIIDNPRQDMPLVSVLRSPIVGLSIEELSQIRLHLEKATFYEALVKTSEQETGELGIKARNFLEQLDDWRTMARQGNLADLIWTLYRETGYFDYVGAMPGGNQRQANLRALHDRARQYEATSFRGLHSFLRFIERLAENHRDLEPAKALGESENVVRIMSIHKSKGLEFPVVFVAGLGQQFNMVDTRKDVLIHKDLGLGPVFIDPEKRIKYPTIAKLALETKIKQETLAEEMRILYVALTRAREKLILVGSLNNLEKNVDDWYRVMDLASETLPAYELAQAKCYLDWLGPALIRHEQSYPLRQLIGKEDDPQSIKDKSCWQIQTYREGVSIEKDSRESITQEILEQIKDLQPVEVNPELQQAITQRLNWRYPYQNVVTKGAKITVTEIKNKFQALAEEEQGYSSEYRLTKRPVFLQRYQGLSPQEKGSALHLVLQHLDLNLAEQEEYLQDFLDSLVKREIMTAEQKETINLDQLLQFLTSSLGKRMRKAGKVKREIPFSLGLPAAEIYPDLEGTTETIFLQGVIDCLWWEEDGWILLDYKSDQVKETEIDQVVKKYEVQINLYTRAVEEILQQPVKERYLYLFSLGRTVKI